MAVQPHRDSLLGRLALLPDPRVHKRWRYPLVALVGLVLLGTLHGRDSLCGASVWAGQGWVVLWRSLGAHSPKVSGLYNTVRELLARLYVDDADRLLRPWLEQFLEHLLAGVSADGKCCAAAHAMVRWHRI